MHKKHVRETDPMFQLEKKTCLNSCRVKIWTAFWEYFREILLKNKGILIFHENSCNFTIGFPIIMKMFPKSRSNFHAARIDGWFFGNSGLLTFTGDNFRIHSPYKNCQTCTGERFRALFRSSDFFVIKYFWNRVVTYLWERDVLHDIVHDYRILDNTNTE